MKLKFEVKIINSRNYVFILNFLYLRNMTNYDKIKKQIKFLRNQRPRFSLLLHPPPPREKNTIYLCSLI